MKTKIARQAVIPRVAAHLRVMGFENVSTRRGKADDLFHLDGKGLVGRGTVRAMPVDLAHIEEVYSNVFLKKKGCRWVHFSYGGYTDDARKFANFRGIALFEYAPNGEIRPVTSSAKRLLRRRPDSEAIRRLRRALWLVVAAGLLVIGVVYWKVVGLVVAAVVVGAVSMGVLHFKEMTPRR